MSFITSIVLLALLFSGVWGRESFSIPALLAAESKTVEELRKEIDARSAEIRRLIDEAKRYRALVNQKAREQKDLASKISYLEAEINELNLQIRITESNIRRTEDDIGALSADITEKEYQIDETKTHIAALLQEIDEISYQPLLAVLLKAPSFSDFTEEFQYITDLNQAVRRRLDILALLKEQLEAERRTTEEKKASLEISRNEFAVRETLTGERKAEHQQLLQLTDKAKREYQSSLQEVEARQREIQQDIVSLESQLQRLLDVRKLPGAQPGVLSWPVAGPLSQRYGPTSETGFINGAYAFHNGIDIAVPSGTPIKAAADGTVRAVGDTGKYAYGRWVAIDHGNGLITLYAHLTRSAVSPGGKVKRGEVVAYSGSTGFSTGPHLHFTVYGTDTFRTESRWYGLLPLGASVNPFMYLP